MKNFIFGLGTGIVVMTLVFYCLYSFTTEANSKAESATATTLSDEEVVKRAEKLGMISIRELPGKNENTNDISAPTDDEIIKRAQELGMEFTQQDTDDIDTNDVGDTEDTEDYIEVTVPPGSGATEVIWILSENGIIQDADAFRNLMVERKATKKIQSGVFSFPTNGDYEMILNILTKKKK